MLDVNMAWSAALSLIVGILTFVAKEKFAELARISILLNKTREEVVLIPSMEERKLSKPEKKKLKGLEKKVQKKSFTDQYGKDKGEEVYYATLTKQAKGEK